MQMRRLEFATNHGFNIQTLNDPRNSQTIHIWSLNQEKLLFYDNSDE